MCEIIDIKAYDLSKLLSFLKTIKTIDKVDEEVVKNGLVALVDEEICGFVSFEPYGSYGLIRYFVFKKVLDSEEIRTLFQALKKKARENGLKWLFSIVNDESVIELFTALNFHLVDNKGIYMEESSILQTKYRNDQFLFQSIEN